MTSSEDIRNIIVAIFSESCTQNIFVINSGTVVGAGQAAPGAAVGAGGSAANAGVAAGGTAANAGANATVEAGLATNANFILFAV